MSSKAVNDLGLYRKMCEPFPDRKTSVAAINGFFDEVRALREKYKLPDVTTIIQLNYLDPDGQGGTIEGNIITHAHNGDPMKQLTMIAQTFGTSKAEHERLLEKLCEKSNYEE